MSTAAQPREVDSAASLSPIIPTRFALKLRHLLAVLPFAALFLVLNHLPLWHTDLWGHVALGNWIATHGTLPGEDPLQPLAEGMPIVDTAWLSQWLLAKVEAIGGAVWLANLFSLTVLATYVLLARAFYLQTGRLGLAVGGALLALAAGASRVATIRPEIFAVLALAALIWLLSPRRVAAPRPDDSTGAGPLVAPKFGFAWFGIAALFALWANLHGSFPLGLLLLGCCAAGRAIQVLWQSRSAAAVFTDVPSRRWLLLTELALAATLLNPYGIDLLLYVVTINSHPAFASITEWQPLAFLEPGGVEFVLAVILLVAVWRHSRRPIHPSEVLLLVAIGLLTLFHQRTIGFFAPIAALVLVPHAADVLARIELRRKLTRQESSPVVANEEVVSDHADGSEPVRVTWVPTLACGLIVWTAFAFSGLGQALLGGEPRTNDQLYSRETPRAVTEYFIENPPRGQIFNPQYWGDWLAWAGPDEIEIFMATHMHHVPPQVWRDYLRVYSAQPGWDQALDRYAVDTVLVDKARQSQLAAVLRAHAAWQLAYEDDQAIVFRRHKPRSAAPTWGDVTAAESSAATDPTLNHNSHQH